MRVAVVDIGTNSTRLLIADVEGLSAVTELVRRSEVTRLGAGVDAAGHLSDDAMERVFRVLDSYREAIEGHDVEDNLAVLTSAVRDATNGGDFTEQVRDRYHLDARTLAGEEEAELTFLGATSSHDEDDRDQPTVVVDIGGGSTEFITGRGRTATFHVSTQAGVVRMGERHLHSDPPDRAELDALRQDTRSVFETALDPQQRQAVDFGIAVAGTATSAAAIEQALDPYDPKRVHGYMLSRPSVGTMLNSLAAMTEERRRQVPGLHPDRAPTIVAGMILLEEAMRAFGLNEVEVSEHDILRGGALHLAGFS